jgi:hypothetical protein
MYFAIDVYGRGVSEIWGFENKERFVRAMTEYGARSGYFPSPRDSIARICERMADKTGVHGIRRVSRKEAIAEIRNGAGAHGTDLGH